MDLMNIMDWHAYIFITVFAGRLVADFFSKKYTRKLPCVQYKNIMSWDKHEDHEKSVVHQESMHVYILALKPGLLEVNKPDINKKNIP